jgi:hypothetical protein
MANWTVHGLLLAPKLLDEPSQFYDCLIRRIPGEPMWSPDPPDPLSLVPAPAENVAAIRVFPARALFQAFHRIQTEIEASDDRDARELAMKRFRICASLLISASHYPLGSDMITAAPEGLVIITECIGNDSTYGPSVQQHFGALPVGLPSDIVRQMAGTLEKLAREDSVYRQLLDSWYLADERSLLSFSVIEEQQALVQYCKILESVSGQAASSYKKDAEFQQGLNAKLAEITSVLQTELGGSANVTQAAKAIREAQLAIDVANLERAWHRIQSMGDRLKVPSVVVEQARRAWQLRSSIASHPGEGDWPPTIVFEARQAAFIYLSHYAAWKVGAITLSGAE